MFERKADLIDPETHKIAAVFTERQCDDGTTIATVRLEYLSRCSRSRVGREASVIHED